MEVLSMHKQARLYMILLAAVAAFGSACSGAQKSAAAAAAAPPATEVAGTAGPAETANQATLRFYKDPTAVAALTLKDLDGRTISSADWKGKVVLVNYWATWCPPCRAEIPDLIKLQEKYRDQLLVIGVSEDEGSVEPVKKFVAQYKMNYPVVMLTPAIEKVFPGVAALPTTFVVDREVRVVQKHVGQLNAALTELETRSLAGLTVNAKVEKVDRDQPLKLEASAQSLTIPGIDLASLTPDKRTAALQKLNAEGCTCGCDLTIARCRVDDPNCPVSLPRAKEMMREITGT
jgi:thiol-disulfide isomerase/thioredoxin